MYCQQLVLVSLSGRVRKCKYLEKVNWIHDGVFLALRKRFPHSNSDVSQILTAIPAKAPAAMFAASEKLGGRLS